MEKPIYTPEFTKEQIMTFKFLQNNDIECIDQNGKRFKIQVGELINQRVIKIEEAIENKYQQKFQTFEKEKEGYETQIDELKEDSKADGETINELKKKHEQEIKELMNQVEESKKYMITDYLNSDFQTYGKETLKDILHLVELRRKDIELLQKQRTETKEKPLVYTPSPEILEEQTEEDIGEDTEEPSEDKEEVESNDEDTEDESETDEFSDEEPEEEPENTGDDEDRGADEKTCPFCNKEKHPSAKECKRCKNKIKNLIGRDKYRGIETSMEEARRKFAEQLKDN